ncbi:MAG: hypothetical protein A2168_03395 [Planctomycetes bacterium RBG_13_50_24]|nr:MAG: hypothetical protein A2168_03395 [Planctomycetes bacterium RBG_13_50_24]
MFLPIPSPIRKLLKILRGGVSPVIIFISIMLGFTFGLIPGFSGLHAVLIALVFLLNVHLGMFLLSAALGKALCFAAAPVLYHIGMAAQGYLSGLLKFLATIPIIGITDFNRYAVVGGLIAGPVIGVVVGLFMAWSVISFRRTLLKVEEGSDKFKKWYSNRWIYILDRILVGKRTKDAKSLFTAKTKIIRKAGVVFAVILLVIFGGAFHYLKDTRIKEYAAVKLTQLNGAEVNLETLKLSILNGEASISGIQVTDANNPENNQIAVENISADASVYDLTLGKVVLDKVRLSDVQFGQKRQTPGKVIETKAEEPQVFDPCEYKVAVEDISKLDKYFENAKAVKEWLKKARQWLPDPNDKEGGAPAEKAPIKYLDYLIARADVPTSARFLAKNVLLEKVGIKSPVFGSSNISMENLNDAPSATALPINLKVKSNDTPLEMNITFDYSSGKKVPKVTGNFTKLDLSKLQSNLSSGAGLSFTSGLASGQFNGLITSESIDLTVDLEIQNMQASSQGDGILGLGGQTTSEAFKILKDLKTTIKIVGPTTEPRLVFDTHGLQDSIKQALVKAGKDRLAEEIDKQVEKQLGDKVPGELKDVIKEPKDLIKGIGGLLGGKKEENK